MDQNVTRYGVCWIASASRFPLSGNGMFFGNFSWFGYASSSMKVMWAIKLLFTLSTVHCIYLEHLFQSP